MGDWDIRVSNRLTWTPTTAGNFMRALISFFGDIPFEVHIEANSDGVRYSLSDDGISKLSDQQFVSLVKAHYPRTEVLPWSYDTQNYPVYNGYFMQKKIGNPYFEWITTVHEYPAYDPLLSLTQLMSSLRPGERAVYTLRIGNANISDEMILDHLTASAYDAGYRAGSSFITNDPYALFGALLGRMAGNARLKQKRVLRFSKNDTERYSKKLSDRALRSVLMAFTLLSPYKERMFLLQSFAAAQSGLINPNSSMRLVANGFSDHYVRSKQEQTDFGWRKYFDNLPSASRIEHTLILTPDELALLWHLPHNQYQDQKVIWTNI